MKVPNSKQAIAFGKLSDPANAQLIQDSLSEAKSLSNKFADVGVEALAVEIAVCKPSKYGHEYVLSTDRVCVCVCIDGQIGDQDCTSYSRTCPYSDKSVLLLLDGEDDCECSEYGLPHWCC